MNKILLAVSDCDHWTCWTLQIFALNDIRKAGKLELIFVFFVQWEFVSKFNPSSFQTMKQSEISHELLCILSNATAIGFNSMIISCADLLIPKFRMLSPNPSSKLESSLLSSSIFANCPNTIELVTDHSEYYNAP